MAAPLLYCSNLDEFTHINGYHGGIGIVNKCVRLIKFVLTIKTLSTEHYHQLSRLSYLPRRLLTYHHKGKLSIFSSHTGEGGKWLTHV